jgi:hypothetical protein
VSTDAERVCGLAAQVLPGLERFSEELVDDEGLVVLAEPIIAPFRDFVRALRELLLEAEDDVSGWSAFLEGHPELKEPTPLDFGAIDDGAIVQAVGEAIRQWEEYRAEQGYVHRERQAAMASDVARVLAGASSKTEERLFGRSHQAMNGAEFTDMLSAVRDSAFAMRCDSPEDSPEQAEADFVLAVCSTAKDLMALPYLEDGRPRRELIRSIKREIDRILPRPQKESRMGQEDVEAKGAWRFSYPTLRAPR